MNPIKRSGAYTLFLLLLILFLSVFLSPARVLGSKRSWRPGSMALTSPSWRIMTLATGISHCYPSLALDTRNRPHIIYLDDGLQYAYKEGEGWHVETVDKVYWSEEISLALDAFDTPHIAYSDSDKKILKYAYKDDDDWYIQTIDSDISATLGVSTMSLTLDADDAPHIAYTGASKGLKYAHKMGDDWQIEVVTIAGEANHISLALDSNGWPHISYKYQSDGEGKFGLKYVYKDNDGWHTDSTLPYIRAVGISLALDDANQPHISYIKVTPAHPGVYLDLGYAYRDDSGWHTEILDNDTGEMTSMLFDHAGRLHISYTSWDDQNPGIKYAYRDGEGWQIEFVDPSPDTYFPSLALDDANQPHVSYTSFDDNGVRLLRYAWKPTTPLYLPFIMR